ncbi:branched-chain amino acid ABC transporter substrate-binding protein [Acidimangrovimonas pyrenivorans]|uniref:Branched-chain amino acid ABC transporter substrate-binding protein n=1 Tax=Acidimangrovimonas pyrenivorans TaxID=2030798 RepID=A0ABV7ADD0_9RHOB
MKLRTGFVGFAVAAALAMALPARADVRIAQLDGLSGAFGNVGEQQRASLQASIDAVNAAGGVKGEKLRLVSIDGKGNPQETLKAFREAVDQGIRIVTQGNSSSVAAALVKAVDKYNRRHPDDPVLYLDHSALDNDLTGKDCSFWHFRFDASVAMKTRAVMKKLVPDQSVHKIYLINQNYALGQQASEDAKAELAKLRPDVKVVGDELHPVGQVKDFAPYVSKIAESGADTVFTANWGNDLSLLVKAIKDAGLKLHIYTFYGSGYGAPAAMGPAAIGRIYVASEWNQNIQPDPIEGFMDVYQRKTGHDWLFQRIRTMVFLLDAAMEKAGTRDVKAIAYAMEGLQVDAGTGPAWARKSDHQMLQRLYISRAVKTAAAGGPADAKYDAEHSGTAFVTDMVLEPQQTAVETSCRMKRP